MPSAIEASHVPGRGVPLKRKIAAILAADVAGYSRLVSQDEEDALRRFAAAREIFDGHVHRGGGRIFNTAGDSVMCEFDSVVEAVRVAIDIQDGIAAENAGTEPARRVAFRIGITIGDVVERGNDLLGDGVNVAARLEGIAPAGGICVSRSVQEAVLNKIPVAFEDLGPRTLKNLPQPVHAFLVSRQADPLRPGEPIHVEARPERRWAAEVEPRRRAGLGMLSAIGLLLAAGAVAGTVGWQAYQARTVSEPPANNRAAQVDPTPPAAIPVETAPAKPTQVPAQGAPRPPVRAPEKAVTPAAAKPPVPAAAVKPLAVPEAAAAFASMKGEDLRPEPRSVPELYHNARLYEAKGDRAAALRAYAAAAPGAGEAIDLPLRYAALLRTANGAEAARRATDELARTAPSQATALVAALQAEGADRRGKIEAFATQNPDFAPADAFLAEALVEPRAGGPTLTERRLAYAALERFLDPANAAELSRLAIDRSFLDGWLDAARKRRGEIETFFANATVRPSAGFVRTESGWLAQLTLPEPATEVVARLGERGEALSPALPAGRARSAVDIPLPAGAERTALYVTYRDLSGREAGPFPLPFDPAAAVVSAGREALERHPDSWVSFRPDLPDVLSYAQLVANRCAIKEARVGFGDDAPREALPLPACGPAGTAPDTRSVIALPSGTEAVQVQIAYGDGTASPVRTFRRP